MILVNRNQRICVLCKYWNGAIGSTSIQMLPGGTVFKYDNSEKHSCFKYGRGMQMSASATCPCFVQRYDP